MTTPSSPRVGRPASWRPGEFTARLKEISMFFEGNDRVHKTLRRLAKFLAKAGIPYAVMGGMAVNAHRYQRTTGDVDVLLTREGFEAFCCQIVPKNYEQLGRRRRFVDRKHNVQIDVLLTGNFPGDGSPGPIVFPDPAAVGKEIDKVSYIDLVTLVQLKLAARRYRDFGDVVELIRFNELDEKFAQVLPPSVRQDYIECLEEKRRDDEYEARQQ